MDLTLAGIVMASIQAGMIDPTPVPPVGPEPGVVEFCAALSTVAENVAFARRDAQPLAPLVAVAEEMNTPHVELVVAVTQRVYALNVHPHAARLTVNYHCLRAFQ